MKTSDTIMQELYEYYRTADHQDVSLVSSLLIFRRNYINPQKSNNAPV